MTAEVRSTLYVNPRFDFHPSEHLAEYVPGTLSEHVPADSNVSIDI